jgi:hypothetical protein
MAGCERDGEVFTRHNSKKTLLGGEEFVRHKLLGRVGMCWQYLFYCDINHFAFCHGSEQII